MGLQVPLLVHKHVSAQALPYFPLGHTVGIHVDIHTVCYIALLQYDCKNINCVIIFNNNRRSKEFSFTIKFFRHIKI